jgi:hypothetical protein
MPMKRLMIALASVGMAFAFSATASAAVVTYTSSHSWYAGQSAGSSFSSSWFQNGFYKPNYPFDATVTFIDNVSYSWHATRRDASEWTVTHWMSSQVKKAHCRANASGGYGACSVYS